MNNKEECVTQALVEHDEDGVRLDRWFKIKYPDLSFNKLCQMVRKGDVRLEGKKCKISDRVAQGQKIQWPPHLYRLIEENSQALKAEKKAEPDALSLNKMKQIADQWIEEHRLFENDGVMFINKPGGLACQGGHKVKNSVDDILRSWSMGQEFTGKLVHRLDRDTSGVLAVALNRKQAENLHHAFKSHQAQKCYLALVLGVPDLAEGVIDYPILKQIDHDRMKAGNKAKNNYDQKGYEKMQIDHQKGQKAITRYRVLDQSGDRASLLALYPETGRTHQLRIHCAAIGCGIAGDYKYQGQQSLKAMIIPQKMYLHAYRLKLPNFKAVTVALPSYFMDTMSQLGLSLSPDDV